MVVYRIGSTKYAMDLTGEGARLNGGRWNHVDIPCIYTAESRALAILEYTVNVNIDFIPRALSISSIEVPDIIFKEVEEADLPGNWKEAPAPTSTKDFGSNLLKVQKSAIIKIPSTIVPMEFNYIINPVHPIRDQLKLLDVRDFVYDVRIKLK